MGEKKFKCKIEIDTLNKGRRYAMLQPEGFWPTDSIRVAQRSRMRDGRWTEPRIGYGSGGYDGTLSNIDAAKSHKNGIELAIEIAERWDESTGKES